MHNTDLKPLKVLIIDDSAFSRQTIKRILEKVPNIEVVGVAFDGQDGMAKILKLKPDVVTLDLEMPRMDGFTLLRWIMKEMPIPVIVVSVYGDDSTVFKSLELGAADFVVKPTKRASPKLEEIENDLLKKILAISSLRMEKLKKTTSLLSSKEMIRDFIPRRGNRVEIVTIGASTGGPTAIQAILSRLPANFPGAIVISQHMPREFTKGFAERMDRVSPLKVKEAGHGEPIEGGKVFICPGGRHLLLYKSRDEVFINIKKSSIRDRYVPSIDMMMSSAAKIYGDRVMGIILTGMGSDGKMGMKEIKARGGITIAESGESAAIYGMPQEIISSGAADKVLPLEEIPREILRNIKGIKNN
jgi:two-component system chemotaxis response regulator CheB